MERFREERVGRVWGAALRTSVGEELGVSLGERGVESMDRVLTVDLVLGINLVLGVPLVVEVMRAVRQVLQLAVGSTVLQVGQEGVLGVRWGVRGQGAG